MKNLTIKSALTIVNVFFLGLVTLSQGNIEGYIKDENTKLEQMFLSIQLIGNDYENSGATNEEGFFEFKNLKPGKYSLKVYHADTFALIENILVSNNNTEYLNVMANFERVLGGNEGFTFTIIKNLFIIDKPEIEVYDAALIKVNRPKNMIEALSIGTNSVITDQGVSFKGARPGTAVYYIDGIRTYGDLYIPMTSVSSIEVYTGGIPAQYGNTTSGVVVVETKSYFDNY